MFREIRITGDPVLRTKCAKIEEITPEIRTLIEDLLENVDDPGRAGLAANQIGVSLQAFSWHIDDEIGYILNPKITELSDEIQEGDEGCLSIPGHYFPLQRAEYAKCEGIDLDGNKVILEGDGLMGRCIQHECGHLDGHLFVDFLNKTNKKKAFDIIREEFGK